MLKNDAHRRFEEGLQEYIAKLKRWIKGLEGQLETLDENSPHAKEIRKNINFKFIWETTLSSFSHHCGVES